MKHIDCLKLNDEIKIFEKWNWKNDTNSKKFEIKFCVFDVQHWLNYFFFCCFNDILISCNTSSNHVVIFHHINSSLQLFVVIKSLFKIQNITLIIELRHDFFVIFFQFFFRNNLFDHQFDRNEEHCDFCLINQTKRHHWLIFQQIKLS